MFTYYQVQVGSVLKKVTVCDTNCFHCGLKVTTGEQFCADIDGIQQSFCCPACRAVAVTIIDCGLKSFYQYRVATEQSADLEILNESYSAFDDVDFQQRFVTQVKVAGSENATAQLLISGIHCAACVWLLEGYLSQLPGIESVHLSLSEHKATVTWQQDALKLSDICRAIAELGYRPEPYSQDHLQTMQLQENHQALRRLGVAGIGMMQVGMFAIAMYAGALHTMEPEYKSFMRWVSLLVATPVVLYSAQPFFIGAWRGLKFKKPGMDLPVAIAIGLAFLASAKATIMSTGEVYFDSVAMFTFLLLGGRYLEMRARHYAGRRCSDLNSLLPATVIRLLENGESESVGLFKVNVGDSLLIKPGQIIAADGVVVNGSSGVDESQMTGEFNLQHKIVGDSLVAGTVNSTGVLTMKVQAVGAELQLQTINRLLEKGLSEKPDIARFADRLASYFVLMVLSVALATYCYWQFIAQGELSGQGFWIMLSVLVVSCPCALSLATPASLTAATNRLRNEGLLVTHRQVWESMPTITDVVCDKTGTLTKGEMSVCAIEPLTEMTMQQCKLIAASLEHYSEHPIAKAFGKIDGVDSGSLLKVSDVEIKHSQGLEGCIDGAYYRIGGSDFSANLYGQKSEELPAEFKAGQWLLLSNISGPLCWFLLQDSLRDDAEQLVKALHSRQLKVHLLSGDNSSAVNQIGESLSIEHCVAGATPEQKLNYIHRLQSAGAKVLMLGDGINDVPVLAAADVSVAMASASTLAKTHADSILLSGKLSGVLTLIELAEKARLTIRQNLLWALTYNVMAIPLAAMAMIAPYVAAIGMSLSSLVVVVNALLLQRTGKNRVPHDPSSQLLKAEV